MKITARGNGASALSGIVVLAVLGQSMASSRFMAAGQQPLVASPVGAANPLVLPVPKSGDLVQKVKRQLDSDHGTLGKFAASLMAVQTEVDRTEQSMLGKVLDLQTARSFFVRHKEIGTANEKLHDDVSRLNLQVEGLSSNLYTAQKKFLSNGHLFREAEGKLHIENVEDKSLIQSINVELAKEDDVEKALKKLTQIHQDLLAEAEQARLAVERSVAMLNTARVVSRTEVQKHKGLRSQLVNMNNFSIQCHGKVEKMSKKLGQEMLKQSKDNKASMMTLQQKKKANEATEQRLLAERALLTSHIKRVEADDLKALDRVKDQREDYQTLQHNIVREVQRLKDAIAAEKERVKSLSIGLMENVQATETDLAKKEVVDKHVRELVVQIHDEQNPILIATLDGQNNALHTELNEAYKLWESVKTSETKAELNLEQANATLAAEKEGVRLATDQLSTVVTEGEKKVAEAVKIAAVNQAKSQAALERAKAAIAGRCAADWKTIRAKKFAKVAKCKVLEGDLDVEKAKVKSLMASLEAKAEVSAPTQAAPAEATA